MLTFIQSKLAMVRDILTLCAAASLIVPLLQAYRTRLTQEVMRNYFGDDDGEDKVFYKMANLDDRIKNADQLVTVDLQKFSTGLAEIYSNLAKPTLDIVLYNVQLARNLGAEGVILLTLFVQGSAALRTWNRPDKLVV